MGIFRLSVDQNWILLNISVSKSVFGRFLGQMKEKMTSKLKCIFSEIGQRMEFPERSILKDPKNPLFHLRFSIENEIDLTPLLKGIQLTFLDPLLVTSMVQIRSKFEEINFSFDFWSATMNICSWQYYFQAQNFLNSNSVHTNSIQTFRWVHSSDVSKCS